MLTRKNVVSAIIIGVMGMFLFGCGEKEDVDIDQKSFAATTWFGNLTQAQRGQYIINRAWQDYGNPVGVNCKDWARRVVNEVSGWKATIPSTYPDASGWSWYQHQDVQHINYVPYSYPIYGAVQGNIIQMNTLSGTPHTAIVSAKYIGSGWLELIESNWSPPYQKIVSSRWITLSNFVSSYPNHTVYEVTGH